jgi:hypothetical protein
MPHLLVALTAHGFGHAGQTAPVINALRHRIPAMRLTLYSSLPRSFLANRFEGEFELIPQAPDVGMHMKHALEVDIEASAQAYQHFHHHWEQTVVAEAQLLAGHAPDAVLANVPYRILAAAAQVGIPALAMCSLNWADIYRHFCGSAPGAAAILAEMHAAYRCANTFLQPAPSMLMSDLDNRIAIGPIARLGKERRGEILQTLGLSAASKLILVSLGGIPIQLNPTRWPVLPDVYWIVPAAWDTQRRDIIAFESLAMNFVDVLRSADALITKPGYGSFVEAACNGIPILYVRRHDWPEEPYLVAWLQARGRILAIRPEQLQLGDFANDLEKLFSLAPQAPVPPTGIDEAAAHLAALLEHP